MNTTICCAVAALTLAPGAVAPSVQPLVREGFEGDLASMKKAGWRISDRATLERAGGRDGGTCLKMACPERKGYTELFVPVQRGKVYRARAWVRCENVRKSKSAGIYSRGAVLFCQFAGRQRQWIGGGSFPKGLMGTKGWTRLEVKYTAAIPKSVAYIQLMLGVEGVGTAWFDDVVLEEITAWSEPELLAPVDGAAVDSATPLLRWRGDRKESYVVHLSRSPAFPVDGTHTFECWAPETRPPFALTPGVWHWRVQIVTSRTRLMPNRGRRFTVPPDGPVAPGFRPLWTWSDQARPTLEADLTPWPTGARVTATVGDVEANVLSCERGRVRLQPERAIPPGVHPVKLTVRGPGGGSWSFAELFCNKAPGCRVAVRDDHVLLVDGKPFFPLGAYRDPSDTLTDFSGLAEAGFNVTHSYAFEGTRTVDEARTYLRDAHRHGVKVFLGFSRPKLKGRDIAWCSRWAAELMDEPGLLTWYMMDEPMCQQVPAIAFERLYAGIRRVDPFHPASLLLARIAPVTEFQRAYASHCDILWSDPYPVPSKPLTLVEHHAKASREAAGPDKPIWVVIQGFDWRYCRDVKGSFKRWGAPTRPSAVETRCMAHLALANGATGLIWYWSPNTMHHVKEDAPEVWKGICETVRELNGLTPFLAARRTAADVISAPAPFRAWTRAAQGERLLAIVNTSPKAASLSLKLGAPSGATVRRHRESEPVKIINGKLTDRLEGHGVRLYRWPSSDRR